MTRLRYERRSARLTQQAVARRTKIHQSQVSMIERGRLIPTTEQLDVLSALFSVPAADLLKEVVILEAR